MYGICDAITILSPTKAPDETPRAALVSVALPFDEEEDWHDIVELVESVNLSDTEPLVVAVSMETESVHACVVVATKKPLLVAMDSSAV